MIDHLDQYLNSVKKNLDQALISYLPADDSSEVTDAMRYSLQAGGKRLRPALTLASAEAVGSKKSAVLDIACAVEMVHTYSLIHDDLPAMDNSELRRGKPTCHLIYGEAVAILAGDALLTLAFEVLAGYGLKKGCAEKAIKIVHELAKASGVSGMIGGQELDLRGEGKEFSLDQLNQLALMKTGALIRASILSGAIAGDASVEQLTALSSYAGSIGLAFQITDDLLDIEGEISKLGKPVLADQDRLKATYPAAIGADEAHHKAHELYLEAVSSLTEFGDDAAVLKAIARRMITRTS